MEEQLNVWRSHYEKLASDSTGNSSNLEFWYQPPINKRFTCPRLEEWDINQEISLDEIIEAIRDTSNYKASGPDVIPIEFYKALISSDDDNNNNVSYHGLNFIHSLYKRI
jgi:hypothetical protein